MQKKTITIGKKKENRLGEWLTENNYSRLDLCSALNCHYNQVRDWVTERCSPTLYWALQIEKVTDGSVTCQSWEDLVLRRDPRKKSKQEKKKAHASRDNNKSLND